jgi:hypothetical protein
VRVQVHAIGRRFTELVDVLDAKGAELRGG